ncbi:ABC transporter ATP-binding protein [Chloroflexia bacterium SDU3-3]|nr:ABC transporter ATP-binding protein [Chloroflexia bacterium SDU3-3]
MTEPHFIVASNLVKIFQVADLEVVALQGLDLEAEKGEILTLVGPSGSGKSTLLNALGGLDRPSAGKLEVGGKNLLKLSASELASYRRETIGFVWQQTARNLLPYLTARENIELLMTLAGQSGKAKRQWADELLEAVGMSSYARSRPTQLSGGQQQRIAIACALANRPQILLGDEPTGEVDWPTAQMILKLLRDLRDRFGLTIVMVTHDPRVAAWADRTIAIRDGRTSTETVRISDEADLASAPATHETQHLSAAPITHEEMVVLDGAGRLQIPGEQRALAGIGRRAKVELTEQGILIRAVEDDRGASMPAQTDADGPSASLLYSSEPLHTEKPKRNPRRIFPWSKKPTPEQ